MCLRIQRLWWLIQLLLLIAATCINGQSTDNSSSSSNTTPNVSDVPGTNDIETSTDTTEPTITTTITTSTTITTTTTGTTTTTTTTETTTTTTTTSTTTTTTTTTETTTTTTTTETTTTTTTTETTTTTTTTETTTTTTTTETTTTTTTTSTTTTTTTATTSTTTTTTTTTTSTTTTTTTTTTSTTTTTTTTQACFKIESGAVNVTSRTSSMFTALITYNCSLISLPELVPHNGTFNCSKLESVPGTDNKTINVTCDNIEKFAGRNFVFSLVGNDNTQFIYNETFIITLRPLFLNVTNIIVTEKENFTRTFEVSNCEAIVDPKYLVFRCNSSDISNRTLPPNCTITCPNLEPGSIYNASLVRLDVPIKDKTEVNDTTFPEETRPQEYKTVLDKVTNLNFTGNLKDGTIAIIHFKPPRGFYDEIRIDCRAQNRHCGKENETLSGSIKNCTNCTSFSIQPVGRGVKYICEASTLKESFDNVTSDTYDLNTNLVPASSNIPSSSNTSRLSFNVTPLSDFGNITLTCTVVGNFPLPCIDLTLTDDSCSPKFNLTGTLGCDYHCSLTTKKLNYENAISNFTKLTLLPPKPNITRIGIESRKISTEWTINEIAYVQSFNIFKDNTSVANLNQSSPNNTIFYYNYTERDNIVPFHNYYLHGQLNSNLNISSEQINVTTLEEAPKRPDNADVQKKIISLQEDKDSTSHQQVITLDTSLFSNEYGNVLKYLIYIRQNLTNNVSDVSVNGTYNQAQKDKSIDYLAIEIPILSRKEKAFDNARNISMVLGNETACSNESVPSIPCNGPLKPSTTYKMIISGCTKVGCTNVLSNPFKTREPVVIPSPSLLWIVVFPILIIIVIIAVLARWKRKTIRRFINNKLRQSARSSTTLRGEVSLPSTYQIQRQRPKPLYKYVNMTDEEINAIHNEYQELVNTDPEYRKSDYDPEYAVYDRYHNIPARGPWNNTAVRLVGDYRLHDYINANEIKGLYTDKQYIACQGPLQETCEDFWEMIIQYKVSKIVMLTRTEERNPHNASQLLSKCFRYFPQNKGQSLRFNRVNIQVLDIENRPDADLEIRRILIKDDQTEHRVFHYYFTGWPDFSVVDREKLLDLIETIDNHENSKTKDTLLIPTVVHCSAGVGRTGTYIAVDIIRRLINQTKNLFQMELDVMGIVYQLRQDRGKMVQTKDQYILVNRSVEEILRRMNRLDEIIQQKSTFNNNQYDVDPSDPYVNFKEIRSDSGLETSCVFKNGRRDSSSTSNMHSNHSGVVHRKS